MSGHDTSQLDDGFETVSVYIPLHIHPRLTPLMDLSVVLY